MRPELTDYTGTHILTVLQMRERSQAWLARKMNMHPSHVHRVLAGHLPISRLFVDRACDVLVLPESTLFFIGPSMHARMQTTEVA